MAEIQQQHTKDELQGSKRRRSGMVVSYVYVIAHMAVQLIYVPLLLSGIGRDEYGLYQLVGSVMAYVVSINGVLSAGVARFYCKYKANDDTRMMENTLAIARRMYWILSGISLIVVAILILAVRVVYENSLTAGQINECSLMLVVLGVNTIVTMNNTINIAAITANERFVFLKGSQLVSTIVQPVIVVLGMQYFPNALMVTVVVLLMNILCATAQRIYAKNVINVSYTYHGFDKELAKGLLVFSSAILLVTIADQIFWKTDQLIIGYFFGAEMVAIYAVGAQIYMAYMSLGVAVSNVFLPKVSKLYNKDGDILAISNLFIRVGRISSIICLYIAGGFVVLGNDFVELWAGPGYSEAYLVAVVIMIPFSVDIIQHMGLTVLQVMNKYHFRGIMYFSVSVINVFLTILLVQFVGLVGAAISTAIAMLVGSGLMMNWYYAKHIGMDVAKFWKEITRLAFPLLIVVLGFAVGYLNLRPACSWGAFFVAGAIYTVLFFVVFFLFSANEYEKRILRDFLNIVKQ